MDSIDDAMKFQCSDTLFLQAQGFQNLVSVFTDLGGRTGRCGRGGFLYGFLVGGYVCGALQENGFGDSFAEVLIIMAIGTALILICGIAQLTFLHGLDKALEYVFWPFWPEALVKIILGAVIIYYMPKNGTSRGLE